MKRLLLEHAFQFVDRVVFVIGERNIRSRRALEKIGGVLVDTRPEPDGQSKVVYGITQDMFKGRPGVT